MVNSIEELLTELTNSKLVEHRHQNVQLKESWKQEAGKELSAYANKLDLKIAFIVIGVSDSGIIVGNTEKWAEQTERDISQHVNQHLDPGQACSTIQCHALATGWIIVIQVANPGAVVHWNGKAYRGSGTTKIEMEPNEVVEMTLKLPGLHDYSAQSWSGDIDSQLVDDFLHRVSVKHSHVETRSVDEKAADAIGRLALGGRQASRLLFGDSRFRVVKFDAFGTPQVNEIRSQLYRLVTPAFREEIQAWSSVQAGLNVNPFPDGALKESLANAVAHACYFERDGELIVEIYADRIEITNYCLTESKAFANKWFSRDHYSVNRVLMEALRMGGLVDELGLGKTVIFRESILNGKRQPEVIIENAGRYNRWRIVLYGGISSDRHLRLLQRLNSKYASPQKALLAFSLALWAGQKLSDIQNYIGEDYSAMLKEIVGDLTGPVFYRTETDTLILNRWARVLLHEGKDSKQPDEQELHALFRLVAFLTCKYKQRIVTPSDLRRYGEFGESASEKALTSRILRRWTEEGRLTKIGVGKYRVPDETNTDSI